MTNWSASVGFIKHQHIFFGACSLFPVWSLIQQAHMLTPGNGNHKHEYTSYWTSTNSPHELQVSGFEFFFKQFDPYIHAKDASNNDKRIHHKCCCGQHHPHLQQLVLFVIQHYVYVILRVVNILPQLKFQVMIITNKVRLSVVKD